MNELNKIVIRIVNENLKNTYLDKVNLDENIVFREITLQQENDDLTQFGIDSITFIHIIIALEEELGIEIPDDFLLLPKLNTIKKMVKVLSFLLKTIS